MSKILKQNTDSYLISHKKRYKRVIVRLEDFAQWERRIFDKVWVKVKHLEW